VLVVAEVALSVILVAGSALLIRSFLSLRSQALGFDPHNVLVMQMSPSGGTVTTAQVWNFERRMLDRLESTPGVLAAAAANTIPLQLGSDLPAELLGRPQETIVEVNYRVITPDYFKVFNIPLRQGRTFRDTDTRAAEPVVLINEIMARKFWRGRSPVGDRILVGKGMGGPLFADAPRQIVGVVGDVRELGIDQPAAPIAYLMQAQINDALTDATLRALALQWIVRTTGSPLSMSEVIRRQIHSRSLLRIDCVIIRELLPDSGQELLFVTLSHRLIGGIHPS
jgi:hypothetical protein